MKTTPLQLRTLSFEDAAKRWLEIKQLHVRKPRTIEMYRWYLRSLETFFKGKLLSQIDPEQIIEYQQQPRLSAEPSGGNHEINTLTKIPRHAARWDLIEKHSRPMPKPNRTPPKVLPAEEEEK